MAPHPFTLTDRIGTRATLGLVVLQNDETLEQDMRRLFPQRDVALYVSRVPSGETVTPDTLLAMKSALPAAARLLPPALEFDAIGYGCTSGAMMIGPDAVAAQVRAGALARQVTDPLTAALAALRHLGARRLALVSPYLDSVAAPLRRAFEAAGVEVTATISFGESGEARVARIDAGSIRSAALAALAAAPGAEAVFLSCTNLRTLDVIDSLEAATGVPVLGSNQVLAWHMAALAGSVAFPDSVGRLLHGGRAPAAPVRNDG